MQVLKKIMAQKEILKGALEIRRDLTTQLLKEYKGDDKIRCSFKHALATYGYACEVWYTDMDNQDYVLLCERAYQQLMKVTSLFLDIDEIVLCGRCLSDKLNEKNGMLLTMSTDTAEQSVGIAQPTAASGGTDENKESAASDAADDAING